MVPARSTREDPGVTGRRTVQGGWLYRSIFLATLVVWTKCQPMFGSYLDYYTPGYPTFSALSPTVKTDDIDSLYFLSTSHPQPEPHSVLFSVPGFPNPYGDHSDGQWIPRPPPSSQYSKKITRYDANSRGSIEYDGPLPDVPTPFPIQSPPSAPKVGNFAVYVKKTIQVSNPVKWTPISDNRNRAILSTTRPPIDTNVFRRGKNDGRFSVLVTTPGSVNQFSTQSDDELENQDKEIHESQHKSNRERNAEKVLQSAFQAKTSNSGIERGVPSLYNIYPSSPALTPENANSSQLTPSILKPERSDEGDFSSERLSKQKDEDIDISNYGRRIFPMKDGTRVNSSINKELNDRLQESTSGKKIQDKSSTEKPDSNETVSYNSTLQASKFNSESVTVRFSLTTPTSVSSLNNTTTLSMAVNVSISTNISLKELLDSVTLASLKAEEETPLVDTREPELNTVESRTFLRPSLVDSPLPESIHGPNPFPLISSNRSELTPVTDKVILEPIQDFSLETKDKTLQSQSIPYRIEEKDLSFSVNKETGGSENFVTKRIAGADIKKMNSNQVAVRGGKIKLTAGMLAAVFITVLVLLAIMTGVAVYLFHRWKFGGHSRKLETRIPSYMPEYSNDCFVANTYLNRHMYLPRQDTEEEITSIDNDSFLNSLEAVTIQNYWAETAKNTRV